MMLLDFEKPIEELLEQLEKAQATHEKGQGRHDRYHGAASR